jgi:MOSC domain-containing protein YiiM
MQSGTVEAIYIGPEVTELPRPVESVRAVAGRGLEGDRYFKREGTFFEQGKSGQDLTLIEAEALEALRREHGIALEPTGARRNVVTRGVALNDLVGRRFRVGAIECVGRRLCEPCAHLEGLTQPGVLKGLAGRGGLRADIARGGELFVGDAVEALDG